MSVEELEFQPLFRNRKRKDVDRATNFKLLPGDHQVHILAMRVSSGPWCKPVPSQSPSAPAARERGTRTLLRRSNGRSFLVGSLLS